MSNGKRWIGIDGGGTKTACVIGDETGQILAVATGDSSNIHSNSHEQVKAVLLGLIEEVVSKSSSCDKEVGSVFLCLSGSGRVRDRQTIAGFFENTSYEKKLKIENDAFAALATGTWGEPGIVLIAGTGSIAYGINPSTGESVRVGGWGYLFGDEGSGYWIGQKALQAVLKTYDGREEETILTEWVTEHFQVNEVPELISTIYGGSKERMKIASAAPLVLKAAEAKDAVAKKIIQEANEQLFLLVKTTVDRLATADKLPVVIHGGLFSNAYFREAFTSLMETRVDRVVLIRPTFPPVVGAYILALRDAGITIDDSIKNRILRSWEN